MARRVLGVGCRALVLLALAACLAGHCFAQPAAGVCSADAPSIPADHRKQAEDFIARVKAGPFYEELAKRRGKPVTCQLSIDGERLTLVYQFPRKAGLEAKVDPSVEYSEQRMDLRGLSRSQAIALLKSGEKDSWGPKGCGIHWEKADEDSPGDAPGSHDVVYRGDSCNCQGRLVYEQKTVLVTLLLRSAC